MDKRETVERLLVDHRRAVMSDSYFLRDEAEAKILALLTPEAEPVGEIGEDPILCGRVAVLWTKGQPPIGTKLYLEPPSQGAGVPADEMDFWVTDYFEPFFDGISGDDQTHEEQVGLAADMAMERWAEEHPETSRHPLQ